ncbi:hypothetical protein EMPS_01115 [Entomortierella parvispora]|uniref:Uncharacterized protein n=1 Tax=Entomortierella parvispora TaxID=205924 RepID=A0A9P3LSD6_9FUNG|nr:hypothetical protein EMPS_01115 [Entomortierella parvispora]
MDPSSLARMYTRFRDAELLWIQQYDRQQQLQKQQQQQQQQQQITAESLENCSLHSGEFAFVLAGLKPAMLVQMPSPSLTLDFKRKVLDQENLFGADGRTHDQSNNATLTLECRLITKDIASQEMPLQGCVLIWSPATIQRHPQAALLHGTINRICPPRTATTSSSQDQDENSRLISESDLAVLLDYPGRLPTTQAEMQQMIEVSYWNQPTPPSPISSASASRNGQVDSEPPQLLTAFAAQPDQIPKIQTHFRTYRDSLRDLFGLNLKLHIQTLAE